MVSYGVASSMFPAASSAVYPGASPVVSYGVAPNMFPGTSSVVDPGASLPARYGAPPSVHPAASSAVYPEASPVASYGLSPSLHLDASSVHHVGHPSAYPAASPSTRLGGALSVNPPDCPPVFSGIPPSMEYGPPTSALPDYQPGLHSVRSHLSAGALSLHNGLSPSRNPASMQPMNHAAAPMHHGAPPLAHSSTPLVHPPSSPAYTGGIKSLGLPSSPIGHSHASVADGTTDTARDPSPSDGRIGGAPLQTYGTAGSLAPTTHGIEVKAPSLANDVDAWIDELKVSRVDKPFGIAQGVTHDVTMAWLMQQNLPRMQIPDFDGSPLLWVDFVIKFRDLVHDPVYLNDVQRKTYLLQHLRGEAKRSVRGFAHDSKGYVLSLK